MKRFLFAAGILIVSGNLIGQNATKNAKETRSVSSPNKEIKSNSLDNEKVNNANTVQEAPSVLYNERIVRSPVILEEDTLKASTERSKDKTIQKLENNKKKNESDL